MDSVEKILISATNFDDEQKQDDFIGLFKELYKVELFRVGLDVILTKAEMGLVKFELKPKDQFGKLHGCCISQETTFFSKIYNAFMRSHKHTIEIQTLSKDTLMHEIAHALEKESRLNLADEFAEKFKRDLKNSEQSHMQIQGAVQQVILKEIDLYPKHQHNSEFLARFYQLLAMSKEVGNYDSNFHFKLGEMIQVFKETTVWIEETFNQSLKSQRTDHISTMTENIEFDEALGSFSRKHKSIHRNQSPKWGGVVGSIFGKDKK